MNDETKTWLKKNVIKRARKVAPVKSPAWCFGVSAFMIGFGWAIFPMAFERTTRMPILTNFVRQIPYFEYIVEYGGYALAMYFTYLALFPICRAIQLCYPEEFEAFDTERDLVV